MDTVYTVCLIIGFTIPLLTLLFGSLLDGLFEGISWLDGLTDLDFDFDIDIGDFEICFLPFSIHSICSGLLVFGAAGKVLQGKYTTVIVALISLGIGYIVSILVQTMIHRLKKVENTTYSTEQLMLYDATVVNTIVKGGFGSISITTADGITTNYPAKAEDPEVSIRQGTVVSLVSFEKNMAIVKKKVSLEEKYE